MSAIQKLLTEHIDIWTAADTEKKSGRGRASGNAGSVYGIKKLRELILELAVRGKLVPQDANDEPASELLKRIQAEKAKLIAEGKLKKDKLLAPIGEDEKPYELPQGWEWVRLPDVTTYKVGKTPSTKSSVYWTADNTGYNWVSIADLNHDSVVTETAKKVTDQAIKEVFKADPVPAGTVLMSFKLTLGKISILQVPAFHNEAIISIYPSLAIDKSYLFKILPARANEGDSKSAIKGNTLNSESIAALLLPLPPLAEQHRIVAKVDELMALCDQLETQHSNATEAHEKLVSHLLGTLTQSQSADDFNANWQRINAHFDTLFTTESSIVALKQALLQLAVMGKLVPQDPNDEPASELLKRIQAEKAKLIAEGKLKKEKPLAPITDDEKPFELPKRWEWVRLNNAIDVRDGTHDSPKESLDENTYPLVTSKDFLDGGINFYSARRISEADYLEISKRSLVEKFDILFSMIGGNIGNQVMVTEDRPFSVKNVALFKYYDKELTVPAFIKKYTENLAFTLQSTAVGGAQPFVALGALRNLVLALPPLAEQHRIVAKVDALMALCDQLKIRINQANQLQQKLANALVAQAMA